MNAPVQPLKRMKQADFATDQDVRWCPGCGDYAILKSVQKTLAELGVAREKTVFVSGIGCSSRFPYYMNTYGFHTIHGRAPAVATGVKLANPELDVWIVTGDGDGLSIGGNHLMHILRRNLNVQLLLFNNEIYGLTKGQYSPTSKPGLRTPSTPMGAVDQPLSPAQFALGVGARFVARTVDVMQKHMPIILQRAHEHAGASFVEIFQNCIVYNDATFSHFTDKAVASDAQVHLEHGKPMLFGKENSKGLRLNLSTLKLEVVTLGENGVSEADILVHDETNHTLATLLAAMETPEMPVAMGVLYCNPAPTYEAEVTKQVQQAKAKKPNADLNALFREGHTWAIQ